MELSTNVEREIERALGRDRHRLRQLWRSILQAEKAGKPADRNRATLASELERSITARERRRASVPRIQYDEQLPIAARRKEIEAAIRGHQVVIVCGETGSGKSTQLPKICLGMGRGIDGLIGHTQPRRIAARSVATRVAEELGVKSGREVGFKIRFTDATVPETYIKLMTDGILLAECQSDRFLDQYDTLIIDEAHERSLNIDFLLGAIKRLLPKRRELKLIITSATIDAARFSEHFATSAGPAPVIEVSGRTYPVEVRYRPLEVEADDDEPDYLGGVLRAVDEAARIDRGDMLIFMPTERDIHETAKLLRKHPLPGDDSGHTSEILPLYARLTAAEQNRIFQPHAARRIVIATNVAESSLTVPGIRFVIDPGTARISRYAPRTKVQRLPIEPISQASADQRKGRCGRVGPGVCIRLYSEADYASRDRFTAPEIQRTNLAAVILQTKALNFGPIEEFPFLEPPKPESIRDGYKTLFELGALDDRNELTAIGRRLSRIPVDPRIGRIVLAGHDENCLSEILILAAVLELQDPRERPLEKQQAADEAHRQFAHEDSDFLGYLKIWDFYHQQKQALSRSQLRKACQKAFLSFNRMQEWLDLHQQLLQVAQDAGMAAHARKDDSAAMHRALLTGLLSNVAMKGDGPEYNVPGGASAHLWPGSGLFGKKPKWLVAAEQVETTRRFLRTAARIDPGWIERIADHLVTRSYSEPHWDAESASVRAYEKVSLWGLVIVPRRRVNYGAIDPAKSRELFILHGLVLGEYVSGGAFQEKNRRLIEELENLEVKSRRGGLLRPEETRFEFFDTRLPPDVYDGPRFEKWRKEAERNNPQILEFAEADLLEAQTDEVSAAAFPDAIAVRQMKLPLEYRFDPGSPRDGITIRVPQEAVNQLDPKRLGWLIPGLLEEKVTAAIRSLPKPLRVRLVPVPDTVRKVLPLIRFGDGEFNSTLALAIELATGVTVTPADFNDAELPDYLRMNIEVLDGSGVKIAESRSLETLRSDLGASAAASFKDLDTGAWSRDGLTGWTFGELLASVDVPRGPLLLKGYPALLDQGESVSLRLLDTPERAARETRLGLRRLFVIAARKELKNQVSWLPGLETMLVQLATLPDFKQLREQLVDLLAERAVYASSAASPLPRTEAAFRDFVAGAKLRIGLAVQDVTQFLGPFCEQYQGARLAIERANNPGWRLTVDDARTQLKRLVASGFLTRTPWPWLQQYPRYFRAIATRLQKVAAGNLARDLQHLRELQPRQKALADRQAEHERKGIFDPQLEGYRWLLEEYRVSLFAQELRTALPVSAKRLDEQWAKTQA